MTMCCLLCYPIFTFCGIFLTISGGEGFVSAYKKTAIFYFTTFDSYPIICNICCKKGYLKTTAQTLKTEHS